jgi:hypothetical protein
MAAQVGAGAKTVRIVSCQAVVLEAFERVAAEIPVPDTGEVVDDVRTYITRVVKLFADPDFGPLEVIFGALYHRLLLRNAPLEKSYADFIIDVVLANSTQAEHRTGARSRRQGSSAPPPAA